MAIKSGIISRVYRKFVSMRTGIYLLAAIGGSLAFCSFASIDLYHTPLFRLLLIILCVNTALCSLERLWRNRRAQNNLPGPQYCTFSFRETVSPPISAKVTALKSMLEREGFNTSLHQENGKFSLLYGARNLSGLWGTCCAHFSIVFIAAGVLIGTQLGFETTITLTEGSSRNITPAGEQDLTLRLNGFSTLYYEDGTVSDWLCDLSIQRNGEAEVRREIRINHPLSIGLTKVYLASQGVLIHTRLLGSDGRPLRELETAPGEKVLLGGKVLRVLRYIPDYDPLQPLLSKSQQPRNPYIIFILSGEREPEKPFAVPLNISQPLAGEATSLVFSVVPVVGVHVKTDPGLPLVWGGFGLLLIGFFAVYYLPYRQIWLQFSQVKGRLEIVCAGSGPDLEKVQENIRCYLKVSDDC